MNAAPISVNAPAGGSASGGANAQAAKAATLPAFAQLMAEKQAAVSAPKESVQPGGAERANTARRSADAAPQKAAESAPANLKSPASGTGDAAKKIDAKGKSANDASASKSAVQTPAQVPAQVPAQAPAINPGLNGGMPWVVPADMGNAAPKNAEPAKDATGNAAPTEPTATKAGTASTANTVVAAGQEQGVVASGLQRLVVGNLQNMPVSAASAPEVATTAVETPKAVSAAPAADLAQSLPVAGSDPAAAAAANSGGAPGNQAAVEMSKSKPEDLNAAAPVALPAATAEPGPAKTQTGPKIQSKRSVQEILRAAAAIAGNETQAAARVSASAVDDVVGTIKGKNGANDSAATIASIPVASSKNETPVNVKAGPVAPQAAESTDKRGSAKSGSNIKGNSSVDGTVDGNNGASAGATLNGKDSGVSVDPNAAHSATPAGQSAPGNAAASAANVVATPGGTSGKETASITATKAGDASNSDAPAAADSDDMMPQPTVSRVINVAQLTGNESHSQVRIAMQADQLGQVELHATVRGQQVGAAITVEKKEAHAAMAAEMPSLQQALEAQQLRVGEVVLMQGAMHSTAGDAGNTAAEQQRRGQAGTTYQQAGNDTTYEAGAGTSFEGKGIFDDFGRLSVRA